MYEHFWDNHCLIVGFFSYTFHHEKSCLYCIVAQREDGLNMSTCLFRHGPFDILGGGGLGFRSGPEIFFWTQYRSKVIFFAGPSGRIIFFHNQKL